MSIGLPLPRIAAQTGVVLQTLRSFSARLKKGLICEKHSNHRGAPAKQTAEMRRWVSDYLLARPRASVTEVHVEFKKSGFDLSRTTLYRIMHSQRRPVRPIRTHKVRSVNCKRRVDFCIDMLSRLHRFDQMQGMHRRIPVKLRRVPEHMALDPARLCFQDEALMRCSQKLVPQHQRVWIDRGMSKDFATTDERLSQHMFHKESQNNPGMMVSGVVNMRHGPLGCLHIVPPGCKIDTNAWLDVMTQHVIPECEAIDNFLCILDNAPSHASARAKAWYEENMPHTRGNVIFQPPTSPDLNLLDTFFWSALKRQLATQYDTTAGGRLLLRRDLQAAWARLKTDVDMHKLLANWRRRLVLWRAARRRRLRTSRVKQVRFVLVSGHFPFNPLQVFRVNGQNSQPFFVEPPIRSADRTHDPFARTSVGDRGVRKERAQWMPSIFSPSQRSQF